MIPADVVHKLWSLCAVLRDDGITYHEYATELTFLLFLKMDKERGTEKQLPAGYRWDDLERKEGVEQLNFYREMLTYFGSKGSRWVQVVFANARTSLKVPLHLKQLVDAINELDWHSAKAGEFRDLYEGLLEKNARDKRSGAGQYFTPRPLINAMVGLVKPRAGEMVQDPAAGTCGFLIASDLHVRAETDDYFTLTKAQQDFQRTRAFYGVELVRDIHRLALMNLMLHGIEGDLLLGDTLSPLGAGLPKADVVLTNPPFGTKMGGGKPTRDDLTFETSIKQLAFVQHVVGTLKPGGRAAMVVPDNVLFEGGVGTLVRRDLMDKCDLHTVLRLPTGILYAERAKTNVLFFTRGERDQENTKVVWIYDMRTNMPSFGKRTPLMPEHFADFERAYGSDSYGRSRRVDRGVKGRFRRLTREEVRARGDSLDVVWLKEDGLAVEELPVREERTVEIIGRHPLSTGEPARWATEWGEDRCGPFMSFNVGKARQRLRWVPAGTFMMGSPENEAGRWKDEGPQHEVTLSEGYWLADTPCTQALWEAVMGENPSRFKSPDRPVEQVSWEDCQRFLERLNEKVPGLGARLPTDAEWERACRAGTTGATWVGELEILGANNAPILDAIAWYSGNSGKGFELAEGADSSAWREKQYPYTKAGTRPVAKKQPNPLGLYDMLGNVFEWCEDWNGSYDAAPVVDPGGPVTGSIRVIRGGAWSGVARKVRAAYRGADHPSLRDVDLGFRLARGQGEQATQARRASSEKPERGAPGRGTRRL